MNNFIFVSLSRCGSHIIRGSLDAQSNTTFIHPFMVNDTYKVSTPSTMYISRCDTYAWFLTNVYNYYIFENITDVDNVFTDTANNVLLIKQQEYFQNKIVLTKSHATIQLRAFDNFCKFISNNPSNLPILYYEDIIVNPACELAKWKLNYYPATSSKKISKLDYNTVFENQYELYDYWIYMINKIKDQHDVQDILLTY